MEADDDKEPDRSVSADDNAGANSKPSAETWQLCGDLWALLRRFLSSLSGMNVSGPVTATGMAIVSGMGGRGGGGLSGLHGLRALYP